MNTTARPTPRGTPAHACPPGGPRPAAGAAHVAAALALVLAAAAAPARAADRARPAEAAAPAALGLVNMEFRDTALATVVRTLCDGAGLDFVLDPGIKGQVTAKLRNTSWRQALTIILSSHGLEAAREGNTLVISPVRVAPGPQAKRAVVTPRPGGTLDLDAAGADIHDALHELAVATKMNIVADKEVAGSVTASLHGLPPEQILVALADSCGAAVTSKGAVIQVAPRRSDPAAPPPSVPPKPGAAAAPEKPKEIVRPLDGGLLAVHAKDADVRDLLAQLGAAAKLNIVATPKVKGLVSLDLEGVTSQDVLAALAVHSGLAFKPLGNLLLAEAAPQPVQTRTFRLRHAEAKQLADALKDNIEGAKIASETANNILIVSGTAEAIAAVGRIVEQVEIPPVVITIDTRIVETNLTGDEKLGIDWSDSIRIDATTPELLHTWPVKYKKEVTRSSYFPSFDPTDSRSRYYVDPEGIPDSEGILPSIPYVTPHAKPEDFKFGVLSSTGLSAVIHMLTTKTKTRMLACPSITTVENVEATVNDVTKYPIAKYAFSEETGLAYITGFDYQEYGTILKVTPRFSDGHVVMDVRPEVSRKAGETLFQNAVLPIIRSQYAEATVRVKDGDTLVIAGLIREDTQDTSEGVPLLSRIPLLGPLLFGTRQNKIEARRNLVMFITPHVVKQRDFDEAATLRKRRTEPLPTFDDDEEKQP